MDKRPTLNKNISVLDFQEFYWLKKELQQFCRDQKISTSGSKLEITERISIFLKTGDIAAPQKIKVTSKFDWSTETLSLENVITDSYKNTENVRQFFERMIGSGFKFNVKFMNWMKTNQGKTLAAALDEWYRIKTNSKQNAEPKDIAVQFEYNTYLRDFMKDNPDSDRKTGILLWNIKKKMRGDNVYDKRDLILLNG